jgi:3-hydroxybutyryl-CoA dehydrogenase
MQSVALAGLGFLGRGIAACLVAHGYETLAWSPQVSEIVQAEAAIESALAKMANHGAIDASRLANWRTLWKPVPSIEQFQAASFVIESVIEDIDVKRAIFQRIEAAIGADIPIASNTSSLPITSLQERLLHPQRLIGMHWAEPAFATRFLEIIRGQATDDVTVGAAQHLGKALGKDPCIVACDLPGFIANRLGYAVYREALHLLRLGVADAETIDRSFRNSIGLWAALCGPLRWIDLTGGTDLYVKAMDNVLPTLCAAKSASELSPPGDGVDGEEGNLRSGIHRYRPNEVNTWLQRFHEHVWEIKALHDREFPLK